MGLIFRPAFLLLLLAICRVGFAQSEVSLTSLPELARRVHSQFQTVGIEHPTISKVPFHLQPQARWEELHRRLQLLKPKSLQIRNSTLDFPSGTAEISVGSKSVSLYPVWPNVVAGSPVQTSAKVVLEQGFHDQSEFKDAIVLVEKPIGVRWAELFELGAKAVIFNATRWDRYDLEQLCADAPVHLPRFAATETDFQWLKSATKQNAVARLMASSDWTSVEVPTFVADFEGSDPLLKNETVLITAHYDGTSLIPGLSPAGTSLLNAITSLEILSELIKAGHNGSIRFALIGSHSAGLRGERELAHALVNDPTKRIKLSISLDLSGGNDKLGLYCQGGMFEFRPEIRDPVRLTAAVFRSLDDTIAPALGFEKGRRAIHDAVNESDNRAWKTTAPSPFACASEPFALAGIPSLTFRTSDDARKWVDTPSDLPTGSTANLAKQAAVATVLLQIALNNPENDRHDGVIPAPSKPQRANALGLTRGLVTLTANPRIYDPNRSLVPDSKLPGTMVLIKGRSAFLTGVRGNIVQHSNRPVVGLPNIVSFWHTERSPTTIWAFGFKDGLISSAATDAGTEFSNVMMLSSPKVEALVEMFPCSPVPLYRFYDRVGNAPLVGATATDQKTGAPPENFSLFLPNGQSLLTQSSPAIAAAFLAEGSAIEVKGFVKSGQERYSRITSEDDLYGIKSVERLIQTNGKRLESLKSAKLFAPNILAEHEKSLESIREAQSDGTNSSGDTEHEATTAERSARLIQPIIAGGIQDLARGALLILLLLIPFSTAVERIVLAHHKLTHRIAWTGLIFLFMLLAVGALHPAFRQVPNPAILFLGFGMAGLSVWAIVFLFGKFDQYHRPTKIGDRSIGPAAALASSNLRRRPLRTALTVLTISVATFVAIAFTSAVPDLKTAKVAEHPTLTSDFEVGPGMRPMVSDGETRFGWKFPDGKTGGRYAATWGSESKEVAAFFGSTISRFGNIAVPKSWGLKDGDQIQIAGETWTVDSSFDPDILKSDLGAFWPREFAGESQATEESYRNPPPISPDLVVIISPAELAKRGATYRFETNSSATAPNAELFQATPLEGVHRTTFTTLAEGLEFLFIPFLLSTLFVANSFLAGVADRRAELRVFASLGMSPKQVSAMLFAEAVLVGVLGLTLGIVGGLAASKVLSWTGWLSTLQINVASGSASIASVYVLAVCLISAWIAGRRASQIAAPAFENRALIAPTGTDSWSIELPFCAQPADAAQFIQQIHSWLSSEPHGGLFVAEHIEKPSESFVEAEMWIAPFDLGVRQQVRIESTVEPGDNLAKFQMVIQRLSGDRLHWQYANERLLQRMREESNQWRIQSRNRPVLS